MSKLSLAQLKNAFASEEGGGERRSNNYFPFWNMNFDQSSVIRFLPDVDTTNPRGFLVERVSHNLFINGRRRSVPCLESYGGECPVCQASRDFYSAGDETNGRKYWKKRQWIAQALIVKDGVPLKDGEESHEGKVRAISFNFQIYNVIKDAFSSDELLDVPYDLENGADFTIKKTEQGQYASYSIGTKFANKQRALTDEELVTVKEQSVELASLLPPAPSVEEVRAMLNADMNGEAYDDGTGAGQSDDPIARRVAAAPAAKKPAEQSAPAAEAAAANEVEESTASSVDDMLAAIRNRRKA